MSVLSLSETSPPRPSLEERALGAYLGFAVGDALGAPVEFMTPREIRATHNGIHDSMTGGGWLRLRPGQVTDDTQMSLALGGAMLASGGWNLRAVADSFVGWLQSRPVDVGNTCRRGIRRYLQTGTLRGAPAEEDGGNGALMRNLPVALGTPPPRDAGGTDTGAGQAEGEDAVFAQRSIEQARITHGHALSDEATVALGRMTRILLSGGERGDCRRIADELVARHRVFAFEPWPGRTSGYVVDTVQTVLDVFFRGETFEACLLDAVNRGGDADTNGALTGQLAGALWGVRAIPERWLRKLDERVRAEISAQARGLLLLGRWSGEGGGAGR
ncbi:ADP-ribosyl-[dinitrogen reductase] hydrolase [Termitidicoccus mucosus]|uniref:ADP-ribosyl-[dinitrogen reductase] hydrolase n=1 Tax=Termitidicoccus mucosus TaxID=1184151 RepID=A0A178INV7_9BACT|nr:ADP-ribosyl-[dinitrogen reductase] hydrolase [Opitutaceae bacterium TSB47]